MRSAFTSLISATSTHIFSSASAMNAMKSSMNVFRPKLRGFAIANCRLTARAHSHGYGAHIPFISCNILLCAAILERASSHNTEASSKKSNALVFGSTSSAPKTKTAGEIKVALQYTESPRKLRESIETGADYKAVSDLSVSINFPAPSDINIHMMPFIMSKDFASTKLPDYLRAYHENVISKCYYSSQQEGSIYFLTIQERMVKKGETQSKRVGLYIESVNGSLRGGGRWHLDEWNKNKGGANRKQHFIHPWGMGQFGDEYRVDGVFVATSCDESIISYNCRIKELKPKEGGNVEHLRSVIPNSSQYKTQYPLRKNRLYWITDRTPCESLPAEKDGYAQFFKLVSADVEVWNAAECTANPNGVKPEPKITKVIAK